MLMKTCELKNFTKSERAQVVSAIKLGDPKSSIFQNIAAYVINRDDDLANYIHKQLGRSKFASSFSMDIDRSADSDNYVNSVEELVQVIEEEINNKLAEQKIDAEISGSYKASITKQLKALLLPKPLSIVEQSLQKSLEEKEGGDFDIIREEEWREVRYNSVLRSVYDQYSKGMDNWRQRIFENNIMKATLLNNNVPVDSNVDLNVNIMQYQQELFNTILNYIKTYHPDLATNLPIQLYNKKGKFATSINSKFDDVLLIMYNIMQYENSNGTLQDLIETGWQKSINMEEEKSKAKDLYEATMAFINLRYFDTVLISTLKKFIQINKVPLPAMLEENSNGTYTPKYRYTLVRGNDNYRKTWGDIDANSVEQISGFEKLLIGQIPIYDYRDGSKTYARLEVKDFVGTFTKLKAIGSIITDEDANGERFSDWVNQLNREKSFKDNSNLYKIFMRLFSDKNQTIIKSLRKNGFDDNNLNVLYSVYQTVFKNQDGWQSWYRIEQNYYKDKGTRSRYNLVDTIYGLICSNSDLTYLETVFDKDTQQVVTKKKDKYSIAKTKFDIIKDINKNINTRKDRNEIVNEFLGSSGLGFVGNGNQFKFKIGNTIYRLDVNGDILRGSGYNILVDSNGTSIEKLFETVLDNLQNKETRKRIEKSEALKGIEEEFSKVLNFIDTMLNTHFSSSYQELYELYLSQKEQKTFFKNVFTSAVKALAVTELYEQKEQSDSDISIAQYISEGNSLGFPRGMADPTSKDTYRKNFKQTERGPQMLVIDYNEPWVVEIAKIKALLAGDTSKSTISNIEGNKIPNFSPAFLSGDIKQQMFESIKKGSATANLLFNNTSNLSLIRSITINTDVKTQQGKSKQIKNCTEGEVLYDAIINKFFYPLVQSGTIYTQCTTQSDKTKFISHEILLKNLMLGSSKVSSLYTEHKTLWNSAVSVLQETVGNAYQQVYQNVLSDYIKLFNSINRENGPISLLGKKVESVKDVNDILKNLKEQELLEIVDEYNANNEDKIELERELHYRIVKGKKLAFNELLYEFSQNLFSKDKINARLEQELQNYVQTLLSKKVHFSFDSQMESIFKLLGIEKSRWVRKIGSKEYVVPVKQGNEDLLYGKIKEGKNIEVNPLLRFFFIIDNLIGNNLRFATTGSEVNHKVKELSKIDLEGQFTNEENIEIRQYYKDWINPTFIDIQEALKVVPNNLKERLNQVYNKYIHSEESQAQIAQTKRNVIMSATITRMVPSINGITPTMNIAYIDDVQAGVFNFNGEKGNIDAHDGSAQLNPIWSILENNSLGPNEVGTVKKPIQHSFNDRFMTSTLLKYATDTITNQWMRQTEGNGIYSQYDGISLYNVFKKMSNIRWHDENGKAVFGEVDLMKCAYKRVGDISFKQDILEQDLHPDNRLIYRKGDRHFEIINLQRQDNGDYYTIEREIDILGYQLTPPVKVYHYFDNSGNHFISEEQPNLQAKEQGLHTIDSLFELHAALGGIFTETLKDGIYTYSESSNVAVSRYVILVSNQIKPGKNLEANINNFDQPLKRAMIHVLANNSATKEGARNINPTSRFYDNTPLRYVQMDTYGYGVQMDSDHTADEAKMTEFSQVISSLDTGAHLHDYVKEIYNQLGKTALNLARVELDALEQYDGTVESKSAIYDVVGRVIANSAKSGRGTSGLANAILNELTKNNRFNININHIEDKIKIPFSDPSIYSQILSTFVGNINKKSIKRQFPGLGTVMVPAYDLSMIYEIDGKTYQYEDLVDLAWANVKDKPTGADNSLLNKKVVKQYLNEKQAQMPTYDTPDIFLPTDNVKAIITRNDETVEDGRTVEEVNMRFTDIDQYYAFMDNPVKYISDLGEAIPEGATIKYQKNITVPRNLAPARITWQYGNGKYMNIFNHWRIKKLMKEINNIPKDGSVDIKAEERRIRQECNPQKAFEELTQGIYVDEKGNKYEISNYQNQAAEIIMSNIYKTKFGLTDGDSLSTVIEKGENYFKKVPKVITSSNFDIVFTKENDVHTYITFKPFQRNSSDFQSYVVDWKNINRRKYEKILGRTYTSDSPEVVNRIYTTTDDNVRLFEVGREIVNTEVTYNSKKKRFEKNGKKVQHQNNFRRLGNQVLEYVEFVSQHSVKEGASEYTLYNINRNNIIRCFPQLEYNEKELNGKTSEQRFSSDIDNFVSKLLSDIYNSDDFRGVQINNNVSYASGRILQNTLKQFADNVSYNAELHKYLKDISEIVNEAKSKEEEGEYRFKFKLGPLNRSLRAYYESLASKKYTSFLKSQYFTVARIPAQTLQSFMQMKNVGFTGVSTGQCFVSHFQTWLQGSDY